MVGHDDFGRFEFSAKVCSQLDQRDNRAHLQRPPFPLRGHAVRDGAEKYVKTKQRQAKVDTLVHAFYQPADQEGAAKIKPSKHTERMIKKN